MFIRIYLYRTVKKFLREYLLLTAIAGLAVVMISLPLIFFDCQLSGMEEEIREISGGYDFKVTGTDEDALKYFTGYEGFTAVWTGSYIGIKADGSPGTVKKTISDIVNSGKFEYGQFGVMYTMNAAEPAQYIVFAVIALLFAALGVFTVSTIYRTVLIRRGGQLETLVRLGAGRKTMSNLILCDIIIAVIPGYLIGASVSNLQMALISSQWRHNETGANNTYNAGLNPVEYRFGIGVNLIILLLIVSVILIVWRVSLRHFYKQRRGLYYFSDSGRRMFKSCDRGRRTAEKVITCVNLVRERGEYLALGIVSILTLFIVTILVFCSVSYVYRSDGDVSVSVYFNYSLDHDSDAPEDMVINDAVLRLEALDSTELLVRSVRYDLLCADLASDADFMKVYRSSGDETEYKYMVQVHMVDPASGVPIPCDGECLTAKGMKKYVPHGVLELYQKISYSRGINEKPAKVKVSGETDTYADRLLCIYVNENTFRMITGTEPVPYAINLKRNDLVSQREYLAQVQQIIGGMPGTIISDQEALRDENASNGNALVPLLIMICCVLAFCAMISVGAASALDAENRIGVFRTLSVLGASGGTLRRTAFLAPLIRAAMSLLIGVGCGVALAEKAFMTSSISQLNTTAFLYITGITAVFAILYVLPYLRAVSRVIHERTPDGGKEKK